MSTDEELDRDWKPNGRRPQSTIARSFSLELMDIFRIENSVADLDEQVTKKKQEVTTKASELEALEARIRDMEAKLKRQSTSGPLVAGALNTGALEHRPKADAGKEKDAAAGDKYGSRPGTARASQQAVPGALPPTPVGSEDGDAERD